MYADAIEALFLRHPLYALRGIPNRPQRCLRGQQILQKNWWQYPLDLRVQLVRSLQPCARVHSPAWGSDLHHEVVGALHTVPPTMQRRSQDQMLWGWNLVFECVLVALRLVAIAFEGNRCVGVSWD